MDEKERIIKVMDSEGMNSSQFALEIGIQGSTLSHILKGRNNPSLEVLKRILNRFRTINSDWLILGIGSMYRHGANSQQTVLFDIKPEKNSESINYHEKKEPESIPIINTNIAATKEVVRSLNTEIAKKDIVKVVIFYSDNTFEEIIK